MSVRVNLLPEDVKARDRASRSRAAAALLALAVVAVLAGLSFLQMQEIDDTEMALAQVQATNAELNADIAALQPFADLEARAGAAVELVGLSMGSEGSLATVLQDLSAVLPPTAQIETVSITLSPDELEPSAGGDRLVYGLVVASGKVVDGVAPGVERIVIDLNRAAVFENAYVTASVVDDEDVATFTLEVELGPEMLTERYGLVVEPGGTP